MANTTAKQDMDLVSGLSVFRLSDPDGTGDATQDNLNSGAATVHLAEVRNTSNLTTKVYLKLYDSTNPTIATTAPDIIIPCPGGATVRVAIIGGVAFGTGLSTAVTTTAGTAGTTAPTSDVPCVIVAA